MLLHELIEMVYSKRRELIMNSADMSYEPNLAIYVSRETWYQIRKEMSQMAGHVSTPKYDVFHHGTIFGHRIWQVGSLMVGPKEVRHQPFVVVNLDG